MKRRITLFTLLLVVAGATPALSQKYYTPDVTTIIEKYGCAGCHGGSGGMDITPYESIMSTGDHKPIVVANDSNSVIVRKLKGTAAFGSRMPLGGPFLSDAEIQIVVQWIMSGAKEVATTADVATGSVPFRFDLSQNYPNPFNPSTTVNFQLPAAKDVRLAVYDLSGREVAVLINERRQAGQYAVQFDGAGLASGSYMYRLTAGDLVLAKKMVLVK